MLANITTMTVFIVVINALISSSNLVDEEQAGGLFFHQPGWGQLGGQDWGLWDSASVTWHEGPSSFFQGPPGASPIALAPYMAPETPYAIYSNFR